MCLFRTKLCVSFVCLFRRKAIISSVIDVGELCEFCRFREFCKFGVCLDQVFALIGFRVRGSSGCFVFVCDMMAVGEEEDDWEQLSATFLGESGDLST